MFIFKTVVKRAVKYTTSIFSYMEFQLNFFDPIDEDVSQVTARVTILVFEREQYLRKKN